ncbi:hypothetical protein EV06_1408 [Prochlorococcus sp. MIT 0602]|nr:hypothetical protein EV06_1408 [Prochlorococcus sp. MIT 0602]KGG17814.1 hypothetical protein EV07_1256 [Prochlorococcus sp. MIT 0603]
MIAFIKKMSFDRKNQHELSTMFIALLVKNCCLSVHSEYDIASGELSI